MEPTIDTEAPEIPAEEPGEITVDGVELNADEAVTSQTVTITDWAKENDALKDKVDVKATVDGTEAAIAEDGKITVEKDKTLVLNIVPKAGYKMSTGTASDVTGPAGVKKSGNNYSFAVTGDVSVTIAVAAVKYSLKVDASAATGLKIKLDDSLKAELLPPVTGEAAVEIGDAESKDIKGGSTAKELKFTVTRTEAQENAGKLHVYTAIDDTDVSNRDDELTATKATDAEKKTTTYTYSVPAADIAEIDDKITIVLVDEAKTDVSLADGSDAKAEVKFKTSKADATAENQWLAVDAADAIKSAYAGETFEFKAAVKEADASTYAIDKVEVKNGDSDVTVSRNEDVYSFVMPEGVDPDTGIEINVTTAVSATSGHSLTFQMAEGSDEGSATAEIVEIVTSVAAETEGGAPTDKTYTSGGADEESREAAATGSLDSYPGLGELSLEAGKAKRIPQPAKNETVKSIKVKVSSADNDVWKLVKVDPTEDGQPAATVCNYTFKASPDTSKNEMALEEAMTLSVATEVVKAEDDRAFKIELEKEDDGTTVKAEHLKFEVPSQTGVTAPTEENQFYTVSKDVPSVNFTVTAEAGYALADLKAGNAWFRAMSETTAADGKTTYNVSIFTSKLAKTDATATAIVLKEEQRKYTVKINPDEKTGNEDFSGFTTTVRTYTGAEGDETDYSNVDGKTQMLYGGEYKVTIKPNDGNRLKEVSYTVNGKEAPAVPLEPDEADVDVANIMIKPLNGNVVITVETEKDYEIAPLREALNDSVLTPDSNGTYEVEYSKAYLVGLKQGGSIIDVTKNIRAEVKDENGTKVTVPRVVVTSNGNKMLKINLAGKTALRGQEITVDMLVDGTVVATYYLRVKKATTAITINNGEAIKQNVSSTRTYPVAFDGEGVTATTDEATNTLKGVSVRIVKDKLQVTIPDMAFDDVVVSETKDGKKEIKYYKEAVITVSATDNDVEQTIKVTAEPLFNPTDKPIVFEVANGASDTTLWVTVGGMNSKVPENGDAHYEVSATAQAKIGDVNFAGSDAEKVLEQTITPVEVPVTKENGTYRVKLDVGKAGTKLGAGAVWTYDVKAKLVYEGVEDSKDSDVTPVSTADTYFASALKLAKDKACYKGNIYTGMSSEDGFRLALPNFTDKKVTYKIVKEDIADDKNELTCKIDDEGYLVLTDVPVDATVGKHTITVTATADKTTNHTMYATRATLTVNVVKGINNLWFSGNYYNRYTNNLYQQSGKKATLKLTSALVYNSTDKKYQPKTKKVEWSIVGPDYKAGDADKKAPAGIDMKNGTVTVTPSFTVDSRRGHEKDNQFRVLAEAADFEGNTTYALSSIFTVTNTPLDVKNLAVAKTEEGGKIKVLAVQDGKTANTVDAKDLNAASVYVLTNPATAGATYTSAQWNRFEPIPSSNFTFASNNKKLLEVTASGKLYAYGAGKKVNVKVTANDGKKANNTLILDMGWTDTAGKDLALQATAMGDDGAWISPAVYSPKKVEEDAQASYSVAGTPVLDIEVMQGNKDDGTSSTFTRADGFTNYKMTVKGAKKVTVEEDGSTYSYYVANAEKTIITLTDPNVPKGTKAKTRKLTLTNTAYAKSLDKATVKFTKGTTLHQTGQAKEQELPMTVMKGKETFGANMVAKVEIDRTALTAKNCDGYWEIEELINSRKAGTENYFDLNKDDGSTKLTFSENAEEWTEFTPGSYKLKVTVGQLSGSKFTPKSQPAAVTLKVAKNKVFTFKPVTSYTLNGVDGAAVLTGKSNVNLKAGEKVKVRYNELQNANVDGKSNQFTHYFKVEQDPKSGTWYLKLNTADDAVVRMMYEVETDAQGNEVRNPDGSLKVKAGSYHIPDLTKIDKKDLTGYLTYTTESSVGYYESNGKENGTVKITVKAAANPKADAKSVKPSQKYVPGSAELGLAAGNEMPVNVTVNNTYVAMSYAIVDSSKKGNSEELVLGGTYGVDPKTGQVIVKVAPNKTLEDGKKYTANLLVVPENSLYKELIENPPASAPAPAPQAESTTPADKKAELIQKYGIAVKITVVGKTKPTPTEAPEAVDGPGPGPSEDKEIEASVLEAVAKLDVAVTSTTDVTVETAESGTTAVLTQAGVTKVENAVKGAASGFNAAVAEALKDVNVTEGAGTAKASVTLSKEGYQEKTVDVSVTISKDGEVTEPEVSTVEIYKKDGSNAITTDAFEVQSDAGTIEYIAKVLDADGNEMKDEAVTWSVKAKDSSTTKHDDTKFADTSTGTLTIAKEQTAGTLTVTATSTTNAEKKAELTLTITVKSTDS